MSTKILQGDCLDILRTLPDESVHCCVTSPPYWGLRDYGHDGQLGLEKTPDEYVGKILAIFREVRRVLRKDGTCWLNLGDSYTSGGRKERDPGKQKIHPAFDGDNFADGLRPGTPDGLKPKDLIGIPWRVAFALQSDGWWLRQDIIWHKPNPMPESVRDRCTKAHEYVFMLAKSARYFYNAEAIAEPASMESAARYERGRSDHHKYANGGPGDQTITKSFEHMRRTDKQRGHSRRHAGFNDRWDAMEKSEQCRGTRNKRSVWTISTQPYPEAHFATFPEEIPRLCVLAGRPPGGVVLDPFCGAGTTGLVAKKLGHDFIGIELNPEYVKMATRRINSVPKNLFADLENYNRKDE